jgi:hypothetical protein
MSSPAGAAAIAIDPVMEESTALQSRKQLLLAESDLNRARIMADVAALKSDVRALSDRAKSFGSIASSAAVLVSGLSAFRRSKPVDAAPVVKPSWLRTIFKGAGFVSNIWLTSRTKGRNRNGD